MNISLIFALISAMFNDGHIAGTKNIPSYAKSGARNEQIKKFNKANSAAQSKSKKKRKSYVASCPLQKEKIVQPEYGSITYNAEGQESDTIFFSRILHVPSPSSGLTLGRGYDMKMKSPEQIRKDLTSVGIAPETATKISRASGLPGIRAKNFISDEGLDKFCLEPEQQLALFNITYEDEEKQAKFFYEKWNEGDEKMPQWNELSSDVKTLIVDLKYRGDWRNSSNEKLKEAILSGDRQELKEAISNKDDWKSVIKQAPDRFKRRIEFFEDNE